MSWSTQAASSCSASWQTAQSELHFCRRWSLPNEESSTPAIPVKRHAGGVVKKTFNYYLIGAIPTIENSFGERKDEMNKVLILQSYPKVRLENFRYTVSEMGILLDRLRFILESVCIIFAASCAWFLQLHRWSDWRHCWTMTAPPWAHRPQWTHISDCTNSGTLRSVHWIPCRSRSCRLPATNHRY